MGQNLSQLGRQLLGIWKQLGINQRISIALTAVIVIVGLSSVAYWSSRADYGLLYGKLDDTEAGKVVAALDDAKVPYRLGRGAIYVPSDKVYAMRMQLASKGIPKGDGVGFEIFDKPNFGISDFIQRANYLRALQGELARTISQLDEVEAARVMIVMPENRLLVDNQKKPTASVFVRVKGSTSLTASSVNSIRFLVANSVEGLQANSVSVVDNRGNVLSENTENDSVTGLTTGQLGVRHGLEQYLARQAETMLEKVLGPGQAVVRVAAEINFDTTTRTEEKFDPEGQVVRTSTSNDEKTDSTTANNSGAVGVAANATAETNNATSATANNTHTQKKIVNNQYEINKTVSSFVQVPGNVKRVSAAVFVAAKMEGVGAERKAVPRTPEEIEKLRKLVQSALGLQLGGDANRKDEITLEEMPFNDGFSVEVAQQIDKQQKVTLWWDIGKNVGYVLLALGLLFILLRAVKTTPAESITITAAPGRSSAHGNGNGREGVVTVEVLNQLIRENPANMNHAVRTWLNRGETAQN
jgi:flagellar M-ring protein FliF